jgi:hypothetical protein
VHSLKAYTSREDDEVVDRFMKVLSEDLGQSARTCYRNFHHVAGIAACHVRNPDASNKRSPFIVFVKQQDQYIIPSQQQP